jgi:hypothetical protein
MAFRDVRTGHWACLTACPAMLNRVRRLDGAVVRGYSSSRHAPRHSPTTQEVEICRDYHAAVPVGVFETPLSKSEWQWQRPFSCVMRWHGFDGLRFNKSFGSKKEAE